MGRYNSKARKTETDYSAKGKAKKKVKAFTKGRKHVNATKKEYNGQLYASTTEATFAQLLDETGLKFVYEPFTLEIQPAFVFNTKKIRNISYTADFLVISPSGKKYLLEIKGVRTERWMVTVKLIMYYFYMNPPDYEYHIVTAKIKDLKEMIKIIQER